MHVPTIQMDRYTARERLRSYRNAKHRELDTEYRAIEAGLSALARGTKLIHLSETITAGGFDELGRPRLAVARSDQVRVHVRRRAGATTATFSTNLNSGGYPGWRLRAQSFTRTVDLQARWEADVDAWAMVPLVPAPVLTEAKVRGPLLRYFTLFEVERWETAPRRIGPDRDPYLLRHLGGELYAVLAEWDLTELERAVMAARRNQ
jgi:hypothetical protein